MTLKNSILVFLKNKIGFPLPHVVLYTYFLLKQLSSPEQCVWSWAKESSVQFHGHNITNFSTVWLVGCWLMLVMQCWNRNRVYSNIILTLAMLHWPQHHNVNQLRTNQVYTANTEAKWKLNENLWVSQTNCAWELESLPRTTCITPTSS